jgi:hypothetical protein
MQEATAKVQAMAARRRTSATGHRRTEDRTPTKTLVTGASILLTMDCCAIIWGITLVGHTVGMRRGGSCILDTDIRLTGES